MKRQMRAVAPERVSAGVPSTAALKFIKGIVKGGGAEAARSATPTFRGYVGRFQA
jgi:hypothetical protein